MHKISVYLVLAGCLSLCTPSFASDEYSMETHSQMMPVYNSYNDEQASTQDDLQYLMSQNSTSTVSLASGNVSVAPVTAATAEAEELLSPSTPTMTYESAAMPTPQPIASSSNEIPDPSASMDSEQ